MAHGRTKVPEIRKGDTVLVVTGKDAGKRGTVERVLTNPQARERRRGGWRPVSSRTESVVVGGLNIAHRHTKPRPRMNQNDRAPQMQQGGIIDIAQPIAIGNVIVVCPHCDRPTRIVHQILEDGRRVRVCRHCAELLEARA